VPGPKLVVAPPSSTGPAVEVSRLRLYQPTRCWRPVVPGPLQGQPLLASVIGHMLADIGPLLEVVVLLAGSTGLGPKLPSMYCGLLTFGLVE
jgi:hypothetical protein